MKLLTLVCTRTGSWKTGQEGILGRLSGTDHRCLVYQMEIPRESGGVAALEGLTGCLAAKLGEAGYHESRAEAYGTVQTCRANAPRSLAPIRTSPGYPHPGASSRWPPCSSSQHSLSQQARLPCPAEPA